MAEFSQVSASVTTLHVLDEHHAHLRRLMNERGQAQAAILVIPCLASEFTQASHRPVFVNILEELSRVPYLKRIIFGLDQAGAAEARLLHGLIRAANVTNCLIQWNDGPGFSQVYDELNRAGLDLARPGKGRNLFLACGTALALGADVVGLLDADISTFDHAQVDRLLFPVLALDYDFAKAYYARIHEGRLYGRVKRLLFDPLLLALKRKFSYSKDEKFLRVIDFLLCFRYQLSGEVAFRRALLAKMRFATNWGVEIYALMEAYRKTAAICQVQFTPGYFDHKHQDALGSDQAGTLHLMAMDIIHALMNSLIVEEGLEVTGNFFRDLALTYQSIAEQLIKKYAHEALFNGLNYDRGEEERLVREVFRPALVATGEQLSSPSRLSEMFLFFVNSRPELRGFLEQGLGEAIKTVAEKGRESLFEIPRTASWERAQDKLPGIFARLRALAGRAEEEFA